MTDSDTALVARSRLKGLRLARGWSLDDLAQRTSLGVSTLSRIETGKRALDIDVLEQLCRVLQIDIATLLDRSDDQDVIIKPVATHHPGMTEWRLTRDDGHRDLVASKWRLEPLPEMPSSRVHPGHDWFFVLLGAVELQLGDRVMYVYEGQAADFSTMTPHCMRAHQRPAEIITIFDRTGDDAHRR